jgi:hypothetical protein
LQSPYLSQGVSDVDVGILLESYIDALIAIKTDGNSTLLPSVTTLFVDKFSKNSVSTDNVRTLGECNWRGYPGEVRAWEAVQCSLDVFIQRMSVADSTEKVRDDDVYLHSVFK